MAMNSEFMAFLTDKASEETVRAWAERQGFPASSVQAGGADLFSAMLESDAPPKFAFVDIDGQAQPAQIAVRLIGLCGPASKLVAIGSANDVMLYRSMLAAGMADYLVKPLTPENLTQSLNAASRGGLGSASKQESKTVVVMGVRGGVGASTVATNMAWLAAHEKKKKIALLDLDLQYGITALALDIEPGRGLRDVVSSPQRVDNLMVTSATIDESDTLSVLSAEEPLDEHLPIDGAAISALLKELKNGHDAVFVDLPRHMFATQKRLLSLANEIVLVTEMTLVGIRDILRVRTTLKSLGCLGRITVVACKVGPQRPAAVDEASFEKGAQAKIDFTIPDDHKSVTTANNSGKMLGMVAPSAAITKTLRTLTDYLLKEEGEEEKKPSLFGFFSSKKEKGV